MLKRAAPPAHPRARPSRRSLDVVGATLACACACHCIALPLAAGLLPAIGLAGLLDDRVEWALLGATAIVGATSLGPPARPGTSNAHRVLSRRLLAAGLTLLAASIAAEALAVDTVSVWATLIGAGLVFAAHVNNRRESRVRRERDEAAGGTSCCPCPDPLTGTRE